MMMMNDIYEPQNRRFFFLPYRIVTFAGFKDKVFVAIKRSETMHVLHHNK